MFNELIAVPVIPSGLATQAIYQMSELYTILKDVENNTNLYNRQDITNSIYNNKYKCILGTNLEIPIELVIDNDLIKANIKLGTDTLPKSGFKALEKNEPKVYVVNRRGEGDIISYYTVIVLNDGSIGVYCNFYSSKIYLNRNSI